jgi:diguanylate cyclase (GGDEF)-like protein
MLIDLPTLMVAGSFVSAISGVFLVFAWMQTDRAHGMLWWAAADLILATAIPIMAAPDLAPGEPALVAAITLLNVSPALIWASARAVNNRRVDLAIVGSGAVFWLVAYAMPLVREEPRIQVALNLGIVAIFLTAAAYEFWRGRDEKLMSRWPLIVLLGLHAVFSYVASFLALTGSAEPSGIAVLYGWFGFVHLETLAFIIGTSIFTVAMARERNEIVHRVAASTDALTGVATRRAFYEKGEMLVGDSLRQDSALAIILFDLDAFKKINDTFGHGPGDEVLKCFGAAALKTLRSTDLIGRLGGEEFGAILPGASVGAAYIAAERIRVAFTDACSMLNDGMIKATVSAGIAQAQNGSTLDSLVQAADLALYRAKLQGRDRVEVAEKNEPSVEEQAADALKVA